MTTQKQISKIYIENFVKFHASETSIQRGKDILKKGSVAFSEYDEKKDNRKFLVEGSDIYKVHIKGLDKQSIDTSCSCPFDWGGICKHEVACLYYIIDSYDKPLSISKIPIKVASQIPYINKKRDKGSLYELTEYKKITKDFIKSNTTSTTFGRLNSYYNQYDIKTVEIKDNCLIVKLRIGYQDEVVKFQHKEGKVYITSTDASNFTMLSNAEAECLTIFAISPSPDLLDIIFSDKLMQMQKQILKKYGLSENTNYDKFFGYSINRQNGFYATITKNSEGLIPVIGETLPPYIDFISKTNGGKSIMRSLTTIKEKRDIGFVLTLDNTNTYNEDYEDENDSTNNKPFKRNFLGDEEYHLVPIIGKSTKNGSAITSNLEVYDSAEEDQFHINKTKNSTEILNILEEIEHSDSTTKKFELFKKAFEALANEKFVYTLFHPHNGIRKNNLEPATISKLKGDLVFEVTNDADFNKLDMKFKIGDELIDISKIDKSRSDYKLCFINDQYYFIKNLNAGRFLINYPGTLKMVRSYKEQFFKKVIKPISQNFEIVYKNDLFQVDSVELDFNTKQVYLSEQNDYLIITPQVVYQNGVSSVLSAHGNIVVKDGDKITEYRRNFELEDEFLELIAELHPNFETQKAQKFFFLHHNEFTENFWFYKFFEHLHADNVEVYGLKDLKNFKFSPYKGKISTSVASGLDWFEVSIQLSFGDNQVSLKDIKSAVINKQKYIHLKDGSVGIIPTEWIHKLEKYFRNGEIKKDNLEISKLRFSIIDELFDNIDDSKVMQEIAEKRKRLAGFTEISKTKAPKEIKAELRHYQMEGLNWLNFLHEMQWGGILADDMGLGKTLQVLTFLQKLANEKKTTNLIVVPTTLLFNWENEIKKFSPKLKALYHYGTDRHVKTIDFSDYHLVFTTYGVLLRDIEKLKDFAFDYAILDESQAIKNPASRRFKAANLINAKNRIALSGTPIENGTFDLFAQMSFVNRGFFGAANNFRENYSNPIDKDGNEVVAVELQKLINPFVLRRTKEQVATELPSKTEDFIYCEMESGQRQVYDAYRNDYKNRLLNKIEDEGLGKSKLMVLEALTRLRQICDSPVLLKDDEILETQSVKIKEIIRHITGKTSNHKLLIFSQFVEMLSLVKDELNKLSIEFEYLDGQNSIKQREQSVKNFQENDELRVFLISLKAGGTGLNLTAADYVYLLDPWWNPAVENQAIDRCYRIGQDKKVFAYRMICKNTIEEKILMLQNKKKKIAGDIIQTDESIMKSLDMKDIKELFS